MTSVTSVTAIVQSNYQASSASHSWFPLCIAARDICEYSQKTRRPAEGHHIEGKMPGSPCKEMSDVRDSLLACKPLSSSSDCVSIVSPF